MKRRTFLVGAGAMLAGTVLLRPEDMGAPYEPYFRSLNDELKNRGPGRPVMIIDLDRVDHNLDSIAASIRPPKSYRVVVKSLPSLRLLDYVMKRTGSSRLMVFHQPFLNAIAASLPHSDVLLGKPLPVVAAGHFYQNLGNTSFNPDEQLQWLIDSPERLAQYQRLARELRRHFKINVEIDVGDHRGNVRDNQMLDGILRGIAGDPDHLSFAGFMGYDAYIAKFTPSWRRRLFGDVLHRYEEFVDFVRETYPNLFHSHLTFNGAGSQTFRLYEDDHLLNDLAAGSGVVMPTDFDMDLLDQHLPAAFIATPVLKRRDHLDIPVADWLGPLMKLWNPNRQQTFFVYGGFWKAHFASPSGLTTNPIYGRSSNSEMVNASNRVSLSVDDHVFLRPTQSEEVMLQFGHLLCVRHGAVVDEWPVFSEEA